MSRLATSFVLGYHGCDRSVGLKAINGEIDLIDSNNDYDWLGPGAYFWESDPLRAMEWAEWNVRRGKFAEPYVVGAVIDLRNCLDLVSRESLEMVRTAHRSFLDMEAASGHATPQNRSVPGNPSEDLVLRFLDCAVIKHLHFIIDILPRGAAAGEPFDTVRGMFTEGGELFPGSGFKQRSHTQIAVRNLACIRGLFVPRPA